MTAPQPGWYPDEANPQLVRWWDGTTWTEHTQPNPQQAQQAPQQPQGQPPAEAQPVAEFAGRQAQAQPAAPGGGGGLFTEPVVIVNRKERMLSASAAFDLTDEHGNPLGSIRQVDSGGTAMKALRMLTDIGKNAPKQYEVRDASDSVVLLIDQPAGFLGGGGRYTVTRPDGAQVGEIAKGKMFGGKLFTLAAGGNELATVSHGRRIREDRPGAFGKRTRRDARGRDLERHHVVDPADNTLAEIEQRDSRELKHREAFTTGASYRVTRQQQVAEPLASLLVAVPLALDIKAQDAEEREERRERRERRSSSSSRRSSSSSRRSSSSSRRSSSSRGRGSGRGKRR